MLSLVLDENISPVVTEQTAIRRPDISIRSVFFWRAGALLSQPDHLVLGAAAADRLTLVTYDQSTIMPLVSEWSAAGLTHAGVVFVSQRTIRSDDFGGLIQALERLWDHEHQLDWTNRIKFLDRE